MKALNRWTGLGRLGRDPETRYLETGTCITEFSMATDDTYKKANGETVTETDWITCYAFGRLAELLAEYLRKGQQVYIEGKIKTSTWTDADGTTRYFTKCKVENFIMTGSKPNAQQYREDSRTTIGENYTAQHAKDEQKKQPKAPQFSGDDFDDDIPF